MKERKPAIEGWFTMDPDAPALLGTRCAECGSYFFPAERRYCRNPHCASENFDDVELSRRGTVWSYSTNHYEPPAPYMAPDPFVPYTVAAVELAEERIVVMGQVVGDPRDLSVGSEVELVLDTLFEDDEAEHMVWKWRPLAGVGARGGPATGSAEEVR
ncbi:MAG: OB-fold domain-containing protein [Acidimicrobiia bacterium]|nr:OB-fold domain-containing protein [Acidimicrobiia bacterium]